MQFTTTQLVLMGTGTALLALWLVLFVKGRKHEPLFAQLDEKDFPLKDMYGLGYAALSMSRYSFRSRGDVQLRQFMEVLFTRQYAEFYMRTLRAQQVTIGLTLTVLSFGLYGITGSVGFLVLLLIVSALAAYYFHDQVKSRVRRRSEEMVRDFCDVVSTLALLTNAGMILREAWVETSLSGESVIYTEMRQSVEQIQNGMPEIDAIQAFGTRSLLPEVKKFTSLLVQALQRGGNDLPAMLTAQSTEAWHHKTQLIKRESSKAGSKLLLPMMLMFAGILIMVVVPMFIGMGI
ncbi:MAG: type II secretion system F family protein [Cellulomonadaceae bacterium]